MAEYTDLSCPSPEIANAVLLYLNQQMNDQDEPPFISGIVVKSTLRLTYRDDYQRREWDTQLMGYRDGLTVNAAKSTTAPTVDVSKDIQAVVAEIKARYEDWPVDVFAVRDVRTLIGIVDQLVSSSSSASAVTFEAVIQRISDPGAFLPRGDNFNEPITAWSARAVMDLLASSSVLDSRADEGMPTTEQVFAWLRANNYKLAEFDSDPHKEHFQPSLNADSDVAKIVEWLEHRCPSAPPCGNCTYCAIARTIPWFDSSAALAASSATACKGNETGFHTCGLPVGGCAPISAASRDEQKENKSAGVP